MRKKIFIFLTALLAAGCMNMSEPYKDNLNSLVVTASYPEGYSSFVRAGVKVTAEDVSNGYIREAETDAHGVATLTIPNGIYRIGISDRNGTSVFNGASDKVLVSGQDVNIILPLIYSKAGTMVIKEVYSSGCSKYPQEGTYQSDKYFIVHNNDSEVAYLDSLCFGILFPWNSTSTNPWNDDPAFLQETVPVGQAIWQFPGSGKTFPLAPGEDAVVAINGAIDHTLQYPLSVNLNFPECFVCYSPLFPNPIYHPAPGDRIRTDHYMTLVDKEGQANANLMSVSSPTLVLFRAQGKSIQEWVATEGFIRQAPGSTERVFLVPVDWVIDGMEAFDGSSTSNNKRLSAKVDAGYVSLSETFMGHSLHRNVDTEASAEKGFEVLMDTNNSTIDFHERETQSLHK